MPVIELSQRLLESLTSGEKEKEDFFDSTTKGLMVQVRASGRKTFYFRERGEDGKTSQVKIADVDHIRLNEVRTLIKQRKAAQTQSRSRRVCQSLWRDACGTASAQRARRFIAFTRNLRPRGLPALHKDLQALLFMRCQPAQ